MNKRQGRENMNLTHRIITQKVKMLHKQFEKYFKGVPTEYSNTSKEQEKLNFRENNNSCHNTNTLTKDFICIYSTIKY